MKTSHVINTLFLNKPHLDKTLSLFCIQYRGACVGSNNTQELDYRSSINQSLVRVISIIAPKGSLMRGQQ